MWTENCTRLVRHVGLVRVAWWGYGHVDSQPVHMTANKAGVRAPAVRINVIQVSRKGCSPTVTATKFVTLHRPWWHYDGIHLLLIYAVVQEILILLIANEKLALRCFIAL
ncbi:hypothetical protein NDU88_004607 [Pleurodeles waltl]|uniref:Uncharacterized protein n=1 Tax=Pleurodeles waltl TaxID=8319 RepID=A0AAV7PH73_PLEWA|nr:hypothetical protein NDU88_004607 [Pleurodeles waltl]